MSKPTWLDRDEVDAIHERQLQLHGGRAGTRDDGLLESALAAPCNAFSYGVEDFFVLAATYAERIARNHPYVDGNKRAALLAATVFLRLNGWKVRAPAHETIERTLALAAGQSDVETYARWLRERAIKDVRAQVR